MVRKGPSIIIHLPSEYYFVIKVTSLFSPTAGQLGYPLGLSATSRVSWSLPSPQSPLAEDACPPTILAYLPRILPAVQAGLLDHTPPHPIPTSLVAGLGFSFWELRSDLNSPLVLTSRSGPEGLSASSSPSKAAPTPRCRETARFSALALPSCQVSALGRASLAGSPAVLRVVLGQMEARRACCSPPCLGLLGASAEDWPFC